MLRYILLGVLAVGMLAGCSKTPDTAQSASAPSTNTTISTQVFQVKGVVQEVKLADKQAVIRHEEIPNYMPAMTMPFDVRNTNELAGLNAGDEVTFKMLVTDKDGWIEKIQKTGNSTNVARPHTRLVREVEPLKIGDKMPEYSFTNSFGQKVSFSNFAGQAYAFTFIFTRCPFPTFCPRMNSNFADTYGLLTANASGPTNWHLFSISFDPDFDTPARLKEYSSIYKPDPRKWDWVTGAMIDIDAITEQVGLAFAAENNTFNHNLRTVVVNATGNIGEIFVGNEWKAEDLAKAIIDAARAEPTGSNSTNAKSQ